MNLSIKITGEGTKEEITIALQAVIDSLLDYDSLSPANWEDKTLFTHISEK